MQRIRWVVCGLVFCNQVIAGTEFTPLIDVSVNHDDNFYKLDSAVDQSIFGSGFHQTEWISRVNAGVVVDHSVQDQRLKLMSRLSDNRYEHNPQLNYQGQTVHLGWAWGIGKRLNGQIKFDNNVDLMDLSYAEGTQSSKKTNNTLFIEGRWRFHPKWQTGLMLTNQTNEYDVASLKVRNFKQTQHKLFLNYLHKSGTTVGLEFSHSQTNYPNRAIDESSQLDNAYVQESFLLTFDLPVTKKSHLAMKAGWRYRQNDHIDRERYLNTEAEINYLWSATKKTRFQFDLFQKLGLSDYSTSSFTNSSGGGLSLTWLMSHKVQLNGFGKFERKRYVSTGSESTTVDEFHRYGVSFLYKPVDQVGVNLGLNQSYRKSTAALRDYESQLATMQVNVKF